MKSKKDEIRDTLKDLLDDESTLPIEKGDDLPERELYLPSIDYNKVKNEAFIKGKQLIESLFKLYLGEDIISKSEYVKMKAKLETITLSSLINQLMLSEHAIEVLMQTIDNGEVHPRMFEVLAGLQRTMLDIMKHQTMYLHAMEESAKKVKMDMDEMENKPIELKEEDEEENINIQRGTRGIMENIHKEIEINLDEMDENNDSEDKEEL